MSRKKVVSEIVNEFLDELLQRISENGNESVEHIVDEYKKESKIRIRLYLYEPEEVIRSIGEYGLRLSFERQREGVFRILQYVIHLSRIEIEGTPAHIRPLDNHFIWARSYIAA